MHAIPPLRYGGGFPGISRGPLEMVQVNLGCRCNQACLHCDVSAGPKRTEMMDIETVGQVLALLRLRLGSLPEPVRLWARLPLASLGLQLMSRTLERKGSPWPLRCVHRCAPVSPNSTPATFASI